MSLLPVQALGLHDAWECGGLFGPIGVGEGKTLLTLLLPLVFNCKRPLLLLPGGLIEKTQRERARLSQHWRIPRELRLFSYDLLGRVQAKEELTSYRPDVIICDEVHRLKNRRAAVTRVVARYMHAFPETHFCGVSGTVMDKSLTDFAHILLWALKWSAPVPTRREEIEEWAEALDNKVDELERRRPGALLELCTPEERRASSPHIAARHGFRRRLTETPGVVATVGEGEHVDCSIYLRGIRHKVAQVTEWNFLHLRGDGGIAKDSEGKALHPGWQTPDDWNLMFATDVWRHAQELALGLFYIWFNEDKFKQCLTEILKKNEHTISPIERRILNDFARMTGSGIDLVSARARDPSVWRSTGNGHSEPDMESIRRNMIDSSRFSKGNVTSVEKGVTERNVSTWITAIERVGLEAFFASSAIERSEFWATILKLSPALLRILQPAFEAARPPPEWRLARSEWNQFVRKTISASRTYDSELHVAQAVDAGRLDDEGRLARWREIRPSYTPHVKPVWCDDSPLNACAEWMQKGGIVWTEHGFFAQRLATLTGATYYGAKGFSRDGRYIEDAKPGAPIIASIDANREGKNLQTLWSRALLVCPPPSASWCEQVIARIHRPGQLADEVTIDVLLGCRENYDAITDAIEGAKAIRDTMGKKQKLLLADVTLPSEREIEAIRSPRWIR